MFVSVYVYVRRHAIMKGVFSLKLVVLSVYDVVAEVFLTPFFLKTDAEGVRGFEDACADQRTALFAHPEDYRLMRIGTFDDCSGVVSPETPILLRNGFRPLLKEV